MRVFKLTMDGNSCIDKTTDALIEEIRLFSTEAEIGESITFAIEEMTEKDYATMPEFTGW